MAIQTPSKESIKARAKVIREILKAKYSVDVSHGHCLEIVSQLFGFADFNTAAALTKGETPKGQPAPVGATTVGELKKALEAYDDADWVRTYETVEDNGDGSAGPVGAIYREYSFIVKPDDDVEGIVELKLHLEEEDAYGTLHSFDEFEDELIGTNIDDPQPTAEELKDMEEAGERWAQMQEDIRKGK